MAAQLKTKIKAANLIDAKRQCVYPLSAAMCKEVKAIIEHNDKTTSYSQRVSLHATTKMLRQMGWTGGGRDSLRRVVREQLGREWSK